MAIATWVVPPQSPIAPAVRSRLDYIVIGSDRSPGKATIKSAERLQGWDIRKAYALVGATIVPTGAEVTEISILFELWLTSHFTGPVPDVDPFMPWVSFSKKYFNKPVKQLGNIDYLALSIDHPILGLTPIGIHKVVFKGCTEFQKDDYGLWSCTARFLEFRPAKPVLPKPKAAIPPANQPEPTALDKWDLEIQKLQQQKDALAANGGSF